MSECQCFWETRKCLTALHLARHSAGQKHIKSIAIPCVRPCHPHAVPAVASGTEQQKNTIPAFRVCDLHTKPRSLGSTN